MLLFKPQPCQRELIQIAAGHRIATCSQNSSQQTPSQASIYGEFLHLLERSLTELFHCLPISAMFQQRQFLPRTREDSTDTGSHLTPSSPLTCSTLEEQEEEGEQQVQDLHAWSRSSRGRRVDEQRQQGHGRTETA